MKTLLLSALLLVAARPLMAQENVPLSQGTVEAEFRRGTAWIVDRVRDIDNEHFVYLDTSRVVITLLTSRIRTTPRGADLWTTTYYKDTQSSRSGIYRYDTVLQRQIVNCSTRSWATLRSVAYLDAQVVDEYESVTAAPHMEETVPNSVGDATIGQICAYLRRRR